MAQICTRNRYTVHSWIFFASNNRRITEQDPVLLCRLYGVNVHNAMALENSLLWVMIAAMLLRAAVYGALYFTLPKDRRALKENHTAPKPADPESELTGQSYDSLRDP